MLASNPYPNQKNYVQSQSLNFKNLFIMPYQKILGRMVGIICWKMVELLPMKRIIVPAVLIILAEAATDFGAVIGGNSDVATIEKPVDVAAE